MGWYYCTSEKTVSVPVGKGEVVAARPFSHVFIDRDAETDARVKLLVSRGVLSRSGSPDRSKAVRLVPKQSVVAPKKETIETNFSKAIVEGVSIKSEAQSAAEKLKAIDKKKVSTPETRAAEAAKKAEKAKELEEPKNDQTGSSSRKLRS